MLMKKINYKDVEGDDKCHNKIQGAFQMRMMDGRGREDEREEDEWKKNKSIREMSKKEEDENDLNNLQYLRDQNKDTHREREIRRGEMEKRRKRKRR